jgi:hypothetical protein
MAIQGLPITVGTTATALSLTTGFSDLIKYNQNGQSISVQNPSPSVTVYLGGSNVTSSSYGYALLPGQTYIVDLNSGEHLYAVVSSSTQQVNVVRVGV